MMPARPSSRLLSLTMVLLSVIGSVPSFGQTTSWEAINGGSWTAVEDIFVDPQDRAWIATGSGGVFRFEAATSELRQTSEGLAGQTILCLVPIGTEGLLAGTSNGVFGWNATQEMWSRVGSQLSGVRVNALCVVDTLRWVAGSHGAGVYVTTNGGATWIQWTAGLGNAVVYECAAGPADSLMLATRGGIYTARWTDSAWVDRTASFSDKAIYAVARTSSGRWFAGARTGALFHSDDGGVNWISVDVGADISYVYEVLIDSASVTIATYGGTLFRSTNNGGSWIASAVSSAEVQALAATSDGLTYTGTRTGRLMASDDGGLTWSRINVDLTSGAVQSAIATAGGAMIASSVTEGLSRSVDGGRTWVSVHSSLTDVFSMVAEDSVVLAGTLSGRVWRSTDDGSTWSLADARGPVVMDLHYSDDGSFLAGYLGGGITRSTDGGLSWDSLTLGVDHQYVRSVATTRDGSIYAGVDGAGVIRSTDEGENWTPYGLEGPVVAGLTAQGATGLLASTAAGVFTKSAPGDNWQGAGDGISGLSVRSCLAPPDGSLVAGTLGWGVYHRPVGSSSWSNLTAGLLNMDVYTMFIDASDRLVVATGGGLFRRTLPGTTAADEPAVVVHAFFLSSGYPNPFNGTVRFVVNIPLRVAVRGRIVDLLGREVERIVDGSLEPGRHTVSWHPGQAAAGVYLFELTVGSSREVRRIVYVK